MTTDSTTNPQEFFSVFPQLVADLRALVLDEYQLPERVWDQFEKVGFSLAFFRSFFSLRQWSVSQPQYPRWKMQPRPQRH